MSVYLTIGGDGRSVRGVYLNIPQNDVLLTADFVVRVLPNTLFVPELWFHGEDFGKMANSEWCRSDVVVARQDWFEHARETGMPLSDVFERPAHYYYQTWDDVPEEPTCNCAQCLTKASASVG